MFPTARWEPMTGNCAGSGLLNGLILIRPEPGTSLAELPRTYLRRSQLGVIVHATDITPGKQAEISLRNSEARYQALSADLELQVQQRTRELAAANQELAALNVELRDSNQELMSSNLATIAAENVSPQSDSSQAETSPPLGAMRCTVALAASSALRGSVYSACS